MRGVSKDHLERIEVVKNKSSIWKTDNTMWLQDFQLHERDLSSDYVAVHKGVAYKYFDQQKAMVAGTVGMHLLFSLFLLFLNTTYEWILYLESDGFHWRIVETSGPKPRDTMSISIGAVFGNIYFY